jgi:capsid protein
MLEVAALAGEAVDDLAPAEWTAPAAAMIDPEKEGLALQRNVRTGAMTHDEMVREQGYEPEAFWREYAKGLARLDRLGIIVDSDARRTTAAGQAQKPPAEAPASPGANGAAKPNGAAGPEAAAPAAA